MKSKILSLIAFCEVLFCLNLQAQFVPYPYYANAVSNYGTAAPITGLLGGFTNQFNINPASVTNFLIGSALSNSGPMVIQLPPGSGLSLMAGVVATNNLLSASNVIFFINLSTDGTNWGNLNPVSLSVPIGPANAMLVAGQKVMGFTNFSRLVLDNARYARLDNIMNQNSNHVYVSNMIFGVFR